VSPCEPEAPEAPEVPTVRIAERRNPLALVFAVPLLFLGGVGLVHGLIGTGAVMVVLGLLFLGCRSNA
jgi:hypothetical protein